MKTTSIKILLAIMLYTVAGNAQDNYDFTYTQWEQELQGKPFNQQQYITAGASVIGGGLIRTFIENQTGSKFAGIVAGAVIPGFIGMLVDVNDQRQLTHYDLGNTPYAYNDAVAGLAGGLVGSFSIKFNIGGRKNSKRGFNSRYSTKKRRKRR